ncbi:MAG: hypothetical protein K9J13_11665 [Saprospiraceae bacterium]|nr:hypothetical protein [Saprospiraceae bacterium]
MRKTSIILLIVIFIFQLNNKSSFSQIAEITFSPEITLDYAKKVYADDSENLHFVWNDKKKNLFYTKFNVSSFNRAKDIDLKLNLKLADETVEFAYIFDKKLYIINVHQEKKSEFKEIIGYIYELSGEKLERKVLMKRKYSKKVEDNLFYQITMNNSKLMLGFEKGDLIVFNSEFEEMFKFTSKRIENSGYQVFTDSGELLYFYDPKYSAIDDSKPDKSLDERKFKFVFYDEDSDEFTEDDLNLNINNESTIFYTYDYHDNYLLAGTMEYDKSEELNCSFNIIKYYPFSDTTKYSSFKIDDSAYPVPDMSSEVFYINKEIKTAIKSKIPKTKFSIETYMPMDDGSVFMVLTKKMYYTVSSENAYHEFECGFDLMLIKLNNKGKVLWTKYIPRRLRDEEWNYNDKDFKMINTNDYLYFITLDHVKNLAEIESGNKNELKFQKLNQDVWRIIKVDKETGEYTQEILFDQNDKEFKDYHYVKFSKRAFYKLDDNTVIFHMYENELYLNILKIKLK